MRSSRGERAAPRGARHAGLGLQLDGRWEAEAASQPAERRRRRPRSGVDPPVPTRPEGPGLTPALALLRRRHLVPHGPRSGKVDAPGGPSRRALTCSCAPPPRPHPAHRSRTRAPPRVPSVTLFTLGRSCIGTAAIGAQTRAQRRELPTRPRQSRHPRHPGPSPQPPSPAPPPLPITPHPRPHHQRRHRRRPCPRGRLTANDRALTALAPAPATLPLAPRPPSPTARRALAASSPG